MNSADEEAPLEKKKRRRSAKNGGRNGFNDYPNSPIDIIENQHQPGSQCPCCSKGKLYEGEDRQGIQYDASPLIEVTRHRKKVLRCNACGLEQIPGKSIPRHTNEARSAVVVERALGMPLNRLSRLQALFGVEIPQSTLWVMAKELWERVGHSVFNTLSQSAQGGIIFGGDDTTARIREIQERYESGEKIRKGCYTSSICTQSNGNDIILYFTSNKYLAENFTGLLVQRDDEDKTVVSLMVDAGGNSDPKLSWVILGYCLAHGRRKFVELLKSSPDECKYFLGLIAQIYQNDKTTKDMAPNERQRYHHIHSLPILRAMYREMIRLFREKRVEPNSSLGKAFTYWLKRRYGFAAFTRIPGMPLDNNATERALRPMAMGRKTSLFFMTLVSAGIWSELFSLVFTCEKNGINAYAYLNWLQVNWLTASREPEKYLPWHFRAATELIAA
ncbi:MAG: transposase [Ignavibacteriaceae bacterium]|nr:transposase [Ignavibacteriaceae bacterium]